MSLLPQWLATLVPAVVVEMRRSPGRLVGFESCLPQLSEEKTISYSNFFVIRHQHRRAVPRRSDLGAASTRV
jgi:hypothetical protein